MMRRGGSRRARLAWVLALGGTILGASWLLVAGCKQGLVPTALPGPGGRPFDFLPPGDIALGSAHRLGLLYRFDSTRFMLYAPLKSTDQRFVRGDSVLAPIGATVAARLRPDLADSTGTLARIYQDARLFGFISADPNNARVDTLVEGVKLANAHEFLPLFQSDGTPNPLPTWWEYNHNGGMWARKDTLLVMTGLAQDSVRTARLMNQPVVRLRSQNDVRVDLMPTFRPASYSADLFASSLPGAGIFFHGWSLTAERAEILPKGVSGSPRMQINPRFLWVSIGGLGSLTWERTPPISLDQCLDDVEGFLEFKPLQLCGPEIQIGDIWTTWTYLSVDSADVGRRVRSPIASESDRCKFSGVLPAFPTGTFSLLTSFEVRAERALDQLKLVRGRDEVVGLYGALDGVPDVVKFKITMSLGAPVSGPTQVLEIYYLRKVGEVVRRTGLVDKPTTRLSAAMINGVPAEQIQLIEYHP